MATHRPCPGCLDGCLPGLATHCVSCVYETWPCDALRRGQMLLSAASEIHRSRKHEPYGSSFLDCDLTICQEHRAALGLPLHGRPTATTGDRDEGEG